MFVNVVVTQKDILVKLLVGAMMLAWVLGSSGELHAQDRQELERNKQRIEQEIALINQMLRETQSTAELNLNQLLILTNRVESRQSLIDNITAEIRYINRNIQTINAQIVTLEKELEELRESYARMIYYAYKNRSAYQRMMFLFSSRDFNQAYLRMRYLQQITRHRQVQAEKIAATRVTLEETLEQVRHQKEEQQALLEKEKQEWDQLKRERESQSQAVEELRKQERELLQQLRQQEQAAQNLQRAIERVIEEERRRAAEAARERDEPVRREFALTPEEQIISDNFAENKGKLPWPLERGIITGVFGEQPHPVLPGIKIVNNGIDISTTKGSRARAIFEGTVSRVISIPGANYAVIIRHGEYLSVYANLAEVFVANGQQVSIRQELGVIATDPREANTYVHLEVWHGNNKLNPAHWITRAH